MVELFDTGAYLLHGQELVADNAEAAAALRAKTGKEISKEDAKLDYWGKN